MFVVRAPRSTLFPYTTLFRSEGLSARLIWDAVPGTQYLRRPIWDAFLQRIANCIPICRRIQQPARRPAIAREPRSEEHTSELQSLRHLVCRLLLEKKNTIIPT